MVDSGKVSSVIKKQNGAALLVLVTALLAATAYATLQITSASRSRLIQQQEITQSLAFAKSALIAYAVGYVENYGHNTRGGVGRLPCPAAGKYRSPVLSCAPNAVGFLPGVWNRKGKRIDIDHLEKFLDRDLWYAVSADFRYNPAWNSLNSNTTGNFLTVDGVNDVVAVVLAPGPPIAGQSRGTGVATIKDYLEGENANNDSVFSTSSSGNDRLVTITRDELMPLLERQVLGYARDWLAEYKSALGYFPYAAQFDDPLAKCQHGLKAGKLPMRQGDCAELPIGELVSQFVPKGRTLNQTWFANSGWQEFIFYHVDESCIPANVGLCDTVGNSPSLIVNGLPAQVLLVSLGNSIVTGLKPAGQNRISAGGAAVGMIDYFDTPELLNAGLDYDLRRQESLVLSGVLSNDQFLVISK